jgi:hypothetical protein
MSTGPTGNGSELHQIALSVARMEGKLDGVLALGVDHETRIRKLERALWAVAGAAAVTGGGIAAIVSRLTGG